MKRLLFIVLLFFFEVQSFALAEPNIRHIGTWNMKWLGGSPPRSNQLDDTDNVDRYAEHIKASGARLVAIQEIMPTHSKNGRPQCYYLDLIVKELNKDGTAKWRYIIDKRNQNQRLGFLYDAKMWRLYSPRSIYPGSSYKNLRRPFLAKFKALGSNADFSFHLINVHMKAMPDDSMRRAKQFKELANWLKNQSLDEDVLICGDTNIYLTENNTSKALTDFGYIAMNDSEKTAIYNNQLSQRFDRFFLSPGLKAEVNSAKSVVGASAVIDSHTESLQGTVEDFYDNVSDHIAVTLTVDVSEERD